MYLSTASNLIHILMAYDGYIWEFLIEKRL